MNFFDFPIIGWRSVNEFSACDDTLPEPHSLEDGVSTGNWVFDRESIPRRAIEYWFHSSSQIWFKVQRNTETDEIYSAELMRG